MTNKVLHGRPPRRLFRRLEPDGSLPFAKAREVEVVLKYASLHFVDG